MRAKKRIPAVEADASGVACTLDALIVESTCELLRDRGIDAAPGRKSFRDETLLAFIGFTSDELAGSLLLALDAAVCESLASPVDASADIDAALCDAAAETANQLMGRLKNRLVPFGLTLCLSTPRAIRCTRFKLATRQGPWQRVHQFACARGVVGVWFAAGTPSEFRLVRREDTPECAHEGDMMLF